MAHLARQDVVPCADLDGPPPACRMCDDPAVVRVFLPRGCAVYPDDREQDLCEHHWHKITPLGGAELVRFLAERAG